MAKIYKTTFKIRRGSSEVFTTNNPVLQYGEPCFVKDKNGFKIGDGETDWNNLPYIGSESATTDEILDMLIELDMLMAVTDFDSSILTDENGDILTW